MNQPASSPGISAPTQDWGAGRYAAVNICQLMYSQPQDIDIPLPAASTILEHHLAYGREAGIVVTYLVRKLSALHYQAPVSPDRLLRTENQSQITSTTSLFKL